MRINPRRLTRHRTAATTAALLGSALALALPVAASAAPPTPRPHATVEHHDADQAPRRHLPRERVVRPLLRHVSEGHEHVGPAVRRGPPHAVRQ